MGNISSNPTKKIDMLIQETNDFSVSITNNVIAEASQSILVSQEQNVKFENLELKGCNVNVTQKVNVLANQEATFRTFLENPTKVIQSLTDGPNSLFGQAFASNSSIMKDFLNTAKSAFKVADMSNLRMKLTNIMKININQSSISRASQNVLVVQKQNILLQNLSCTDSDITIAQEAIVKAFQNVLVQVVSDTLSSNPSFRQAIREFNGDYNKGLLDEQVDNYADMPKACMSDLIPPTKLEACPPCSDCPICPAQVPCDQSIPVYGDFLFSARMFYIVISICVIIILLSILFKR